MWIVYLLGSTPRSQDAIVAIKGLVWDSLLKNEIILVVTVTGWEYYLPIAQQTSCFLGLT